MKAYAVRSYKGPLQPVDVDEPAVGEDDVRIQISAAGLNQLDEKVRLGEFRTFLRYRPPFPLGHDAAGTVLRTGARVTAFAPGDRVYTRPRDGRIGTFAERIAVHADDVAHAPSSVSDEEAASLPLVALTAWQALVVHGRVKAGDKVLVHAGAGGVGVVAIQLAKHLGATVAVTVGAANADLVRGLGADEVVDHRAERFEERLSGFDVVLDGVGADNVLRSLTVLRPGGVVIGLAGPPDPAFARDRGVNPVLRLAISALSRKVRGRARQLGVRYRFLFMSADGGQLAEIADLVHRSVIRPVVGRTVPFDALPRVLSGVGRDGTAGKTVAVAGPPPAASTEGAPQA